MTDKLKSECGYESVPVCGRCYSDLSVKVANLEAALKNGALERIKFVDWAVDKRTKLEAELALVREANNKEYREIGRLNAELQAQARLHSVELLKAEKSGVAYGLGEFNAHHRVWDHPVQNALLLRQKQIDDKITTVSEA